MPTTLTDLKEQRKQVRSAGAKATQLSGVGSTFIANVKEELRKRAQEKGVSQLSQQAASARKEFTAAPARIREEYQGIDPYKMMSAVSERRGSILAELEEIAGLKSQRQTTITDILGGMRGGIEAETARESQRAQLEQALYGEMVQELQLQQAAERMEMERESAGLTDTLAREKLGWEQEQYEREFPWQELLWQYALDKPHYKPTVSGGGDDWGGWG